MNKEEFAKFISESNDISKAEASRVISMFTSAVQDALAAKNNISLIGFGTFDVLQTKERQGRNPATGQPMKIKASKRPTFKAGKALKDSVSA